MGTPQDRHESPFGDEPHGTVVAKGTGRWTALGDSDPHLVREVHDDSLLVDVMIASAAAADRTFSFLIPRSDGLFWGVLVNEPTLAPASRSVPSPSTQTTEAVIHLSRMSSLPFGLTARELEVLSLIAGGQTNQQIAATLSISDRTVTTHVERVLLKMSTPTRTAAGVAAINEGLIQLPLPHECGVLATTPWGIVSDRYRRGTAHRSTRRSLPTARKRPLLLATALPLKGSAAEDGVEMLRGTQLALKELNDAGGIGGVPVELHVSEVDVDDGSSVASAFQNIIDLEPDAITSGYVGRQDIAHQLVASYGSPYLHAATLSALAREVADTPAYRRIFQVCPSDNNYGPGFIRFVSDIRDSGHWHPRSREVLIVQQDWPLSDFGLQAMNLEAEINGWTVGAPVRMGTSPDTWTAAAQEVITRAPAAVLLSDYMLAPTVEFIRAFLSKPSPTLLYCIYSPSIPGFRTRLGPLVNGVLWATVTGTYSDPIGRAFASRYRAQFGVAPGRSHAGIAYDRVRLIANAWALASNPRDFAAVADVLRTNTYRGVNGAYFLGSVDQVALSYPDVTADPSVAQAHLVYQFQGLRHRIVSPAPYRDARFETPHWIEP